MAKKLEIKEWRIVTGLQDAVLLQKIYDFLMSLQPLYSGLSNATIRLSLPSFRGDTGYIETLSFKEDKDLMCGICLAYYHQNK